MEPVNHEEQYRFLRNNPLQYARVGVERAIYYGAFSTATVLITHRAFRETPLEQIVLGSLIGTAIGAAVMGGAHYVSARRHQRQRAIKNPTV